MRQNREKGSQAMKFPLTAVSPRTPFCQTVRQIRVLVVGPVLLANALSALLATLDDIQVLPPFSEPDHLLPFVQRVRKTEHPIDIILLHQSTDFEGDRLLLKALTAIGQRCLIITLFHFPHEMECIQQAGVWGLFFDSSPVAHLVTALRTIASGQKSFPQNLPDLPASLTTSARRSRQMAFHEERLKALAREIMWNLNPTELNIFRHLTHAKIEEIATTIHLRPATVRRELCERVYPFLKLVSGRPVPNRLVALQVLQEYGVLEYVLPPPS